tara:strand:+ start:239 stop:955 length:717 start_codon:yes stop_codon:yes gene_type:complete
MGYQEKSSCGVSVVATLTNVGKKLLLTNPASFKIDRFRPMDTGVDYRLYDTTNTDGSTKYGVAIESLPNLEPHGDASVHKNGWKLILNMDDDVIKVPYIETIPSFTAGMTFNKLEDYNDLELNILNIDTTNLKARWTILNKAVATMETIGGVTPTDVTDDFTSSGNYSNSVGGEYSAEPLSWEVPFGTKMRLKPQFNQDGTTSDYKQTNVLIEETNSGQEIQIGITTMYNAQIDLSQS